MINAIIRKMIMAAIHKQWPNAEFDVIVKQGKTKYVKGKWSVDYDKNGPRVVMTIDISESPIEGEFKVK